ncbi:alpha/beta fold hydrolase [Sphingomonas bacterium]|uniref:alpha/beta fold hydrolase n=1 Tax=Sphingomonas bacterium TaxID=1895847 RepID=UPI001575FF55|nr:alpha/beta hydrolase [Sphingomonas bacterium]
MVHVRRSYVDVGGRQMHLRRAAPEDGADAPPLFCFHMSPMSGRVYEAFLAAIGTDRTAIAPDTPGFGASDQPPPLPTIDDYADAMAALIEATGVTRPVDLMGYHTGSLIAVALAHRHPAFVRRIVAIGMPIFDDADRAELQALYARVPPAEDGSHLVDFWRRFLLWNRAGGSTIDEVADAFPCGLLGRADGWWGHRAAFAFAAEAVLPHVAQPLLVLNPADDLTAQTARAAPLLRNGHMLDVPGWGHGFLDRQTRDAARLVRSFLDAPDEAPFATLAPGSGAVPRMVPA